MREILVRDDALAGTTLAAAQESLLTSPYVVSDTGRAGFTATFTRVGLPEVRERFEFLIRPLDCLVPARTYRGLFGWRERLTELLATNRPNAFYLKILFLEPGEGWGPRLATTLQQKVNAPFPHPRVVSLLYLRHPEVTSGASLRLSRDGRPVAEVPARSGRLVQIRGDIEHGLTPLAGAEGEASVVVVCEQYSYAGPVAARLSPVAVSSGPRFEAALSAARDGPPPKFLVDGPGGEGRPAQELLREE